MAEGADAIMRGFFRRFRPSQERDKGFLQNIFRFTVAQAQRPSVQDEFSGFFLIKPLAPIGLSLQQTFAHFITLIDIATRAICMANFAGIMNVDETTEFPFQQTASACSILHPIVRIPFPISLSLPRAAYPTPLIGGSIDEKRQKLGLGEARYGSVAPKAERTADFGNG